MKIYLKIVNVNSSVRLYLFLSIDVDKKNKDEADRCHPISFCTINMLRVFIKNFTEEDAI